jgi:hypothetical protein
MDKITIIYLEFEEHKINEVMKLIKDKFGEFGEDNNDKFREIGTTFLEFEVWNWDLDESDFEDFKICSQINVSSYEDNEYDESNFIWENE